MLNRSVEYVSKITIKTGYAEKYGDQGRAVAEREAALEQEHVELVALQDSTKAKQASVKQLLADKEAELTAYNSKIPPPRTRSPVTRADIKAQEDKMRQDRG